VPEYARYASPLPGLYLCGAGTHPGGGVTGAPGHNAARRILDDLRRGRGLRARRAETSPQ
jgi:phytoene dehydrogenase-like protein